MSRKERRAAEHKERKAARKAGFPTIPATPETSIETASVNNERDAISPARLSANRANAQLSRGSVTPAGKAISSQNRTTHGLTRHNGAFRLLASEDPNGFEALKDALASEHEPASETEAILVNTMAESHWLAHRALTLQHTCFDPETGAVANEKLFSLYMRYQTTHTRAFHKSFNDLQKLKAQRRRERLGFEAQKSKDTEQLRKKQIHDFQEQTTRHYQAWRDPATQADTVRLAMAAFHRDPDYDHLNAEFNAKYGAKEEEVSSETAA